ncbi:hypothetical protein G9A89_002443 [Geosiphon pyriformis]|nr:hypothetical protein G9A89_002443 [Geosiphon pyriformis]
MLLEAVQFFFSPFFNVFEPYVSRFTHALTSPKTQRVAVKSIFVAIVAVTLVSVAFISYLGFYWLYVPKIYHVKPVYLQYHQDTLPTAMINFTTSGSRFLTAGQAYDVTVDLYVPTSQKNIELGNFMIRLQLNSEQANNETVQNERRPCILTYQSPLLRVFYTLWRLIPLILGYAKEDQLLVVKMVENMIEDPNKRVSHGYITLSDPRLETYDVKIRFDAHFRGLRYFMYYYPVATATTFISLFLFWELLFSFVAWRNLVALWQNQLPSPIPEQFQDDTPKVATGEDDESQNGEVADAEDEGLGGTWETIRHESEIRGADGGSTTGADSEFEGSRHGSVISDPNPQRDIPRSRQSSEPAEAIYTTESYVSEDDIQSVRSRRTQDDLASIAAETNSEDDNLGSDDGSPTPTTMRSRRTSASAASLTTDEEYEGEAGLTAATSSSRAIASGSRPYSRRVGKGDDSDSHVDDSNRY